MPAVVQRRKARRKAPSQLPIWWARRTRSCDKICFLFKPEQLFDETALCRNNRFSLGRERTQWQLFKRNNQTRVDEARWRTVVRHCTVTCRWRTSAAAATRWWKRSSFRRLRSPAGWNDDEAQSLSRPPTRHWSLRPEAAYPMKSLWHRSPATVDASYRRAGRDARTTGLRWFIVWRTSVRRAEGSVRPKCWSERALSAWLRTFRLFLDRGNLAVLEQSSFDFEVFSPLIFAMSLCCFDHFYHTLFFTITDFVECLALIA